MGEILEKRIERYLHSECTRRGWLCEKFTSPNKRFVPDRIITVPNRMILVELKSPNGKLSSGQMRDHSRRKKLGITVLTLSSREQVNQFINYLERIVNHETNS